MIIKVFRGPLTKGNYPLVSEPDIKEAYFKENNDKKHYFLGKVLRRNITRRKFCRSRANRLFYFDLEPNCPPNMR